MKKKRLIVLIILAILIVVILSLVVTSAFMKPIENGGNLTEVSLSSCAKITLEGSDSINLSNTYPMSRNRGFQTTPYTFKVTSYCDTYIGFNFYLATLSSNTLDASNIHYIITNKGSKEALAEGTLTSSLAVSDFSEAEITELNTGLGGSYGAIYRLYNANVPYQGSKEFDLYLFVDSSVETAGGTFKAGVAIKSYEREETAYHEECNIDINNDTLACYVARQYTGKQGENNLYYHNGTILGDDGTVLDAEDNSYRYAGGDYVVTNLATSAGLTSVSETSASAGDGVINFYCDGTRSTPKSYCSGASYFTLSYDETTTYPNVKAVYDKALEDGYLKTDLVKNYVCFGSDADTCPNDNLYRIIGVFDGRVRLIKADYATSAMLGTDTSDYYGTYSYVTSYYQGDSSNLTSIAGYYWNNANYSATNTATGYYNDWSYSKLNKTHLNKNFLKNIGSTWSSVIDTTEWKVGGNTYETMIGDDIAESNAKIAYTNEITSPSTEVISTYKSQVGLMFVSDYYYGASSTYWTYPGFDDYDANDYRAATGENWMYMGLHEWTITRWVSSSRNLAYRVGYRGDLGGTGINIISFAVRPVFHLNSDVTYVSGSGTKSSPIRIN